MIRISRLSNNIPFVREEMGYLGTVSLGVWVKCGSAYENHDNNGMAHLVEHMLFKGTGSKNATEISDVMTSLGSGFNAYTAKEFTCFYVTVLTEHLSSAVSLLAEMLTDSVFDENEFKREKDVVLDEIALYNDSPDDAVYEMLEKSVWKDHPLGFQISGDEEQVGAYTRDELYDFYQKNYVSGNIVISAAGNFDDDKLVELLQSKFEKIKSGPENSGLTVPEYRRCIYVEKKDTDQIYLNVCMPGCTVNAPDRYADSVIETILGGSESSRLFRKVRDEKGLTYSISSSTDSYICAGLSFADVIVDREKMGITLETILDIIKDIRKSGITERELIRTKEQVKSELMIEAESTRYRMSSYGKGMLFRNRAMSAGEVIDMINSVDIEACMNVAGKYLDTENLSVSVVGPVTKNDVNFIKNLTGISTVLDKS